MLREFETVLVAEKNETDPLRTFYSGVNSELVKQLKATNAKLIWCATTPVPEDDLNPSRNNSAVIAYNAIARKIMDENGVAIDDRYTFALPQLAKIQLSANVHFTPEGYKALADQVVAAIVKALAKPK